MNLDDESRNESVAPGLVDAVADANREARPERATTDPAATGSTGPQNDRTQKQTEKSKSTEDEEDLSDNQKGLDTQDYSREKKSEDKSEESPTEQVEATSQKETTVDDEWYKSLPAAPAEFSLTPPEPDELGRVDPEEYTNYLEAKIEHKAAVRAYNTAYITKAFESAETILPELKTNPALQQIVKQTFISDPTNPNNNPIEIAKGLKEMFETKEMEGADNAKTQITIQKSAAVEKSGSSKTRQSPKKDDSFDRRLAKNDPAAFEELLGEWASQGKI